MSAGTNAKGLRLFRRESCLSYAVYDRGAGVAAWIDADQASMDEYRAFLSEYGLRPVLALDTGPCSAHRPAGGLLRAEYGLEVFGTPSGRALADGERLDVGALRLRIVDSHRAVHGGRSGEPFVVAEAEGLPALVFTGAAVPIGAYPPRALEGLPPGALLCPARVSEEILFSTVETENARAEAVRAAAGEGEEDAGENARTATAITIEKYELKIGRPKPGDAFIDVREPHEFAEAHIPGTRNVPLSELGLRLHELRAAERVYLSCLSGRRSAAAARTLAYVGLGNVVNVLGGFQAWKGAGFEIVK